MTLALTPPKWMGSAVCATVDPDLFFPEAGGMWSASIARGICANCPVQVDCRTYAVDRPELTGVWGGTSDRQRRDLRNRRAAAA